MTDTTDKTDDRDQRVVEFEKEVNDALGRLVLTVQTRLSGFNGALVDVVTIATRAYAEQVALTAEATAQRNIAARNAGKARTYIDRFRNAVANAVASGRTNLDGLEAGERAVVVDVANQSRELWRAKQQTENPALLWSPPKSPADPLRAELALMEGLVDLAKADPSAPSRVARWAADRFAAAKAAD